MGALAGLSSAAGAGCATTGASQAGSYDPTRMPDMDAFLAQFDHSMAAIAHGNPLREFFPEGPPAAADPRGGPHPHAELVKKSLRSLLITGSFRDLPEEARLHPGMQERMIGSMQEMDEAVFGMTHVLSSFTPEERVRVREVLNEEPDLGMRIAESLDRGAVAAGVPAARRLHLRTLSAKLSFRLKHQPVTTLIDEYVAKVQKVAARHGYTEEMQRRIAARVTNAALLGMQAGPAPSSSAAPPAPSSSAAPPPPPSPSVGGSPPPGQSLPPQAVGAQPTPAVSPPYPYPYPYPYPPYAYPRPSPEPVPEPSDPKNLKPGRTPITVGAILLGIGAATGLAAIGVTALAGLAGAFVLTAGAVLLLAGLITLVVGLAIRAASD
jgi:hypothetical protein